MNKDYPIQSEELGTENHYACPDHYMVCICECGCESPRIKRGKINMQPKEKKECWCKTRAICSEKCPCKCHSPAMEEWEIELRSKFIGMAPAKKETIKYGESLVKFIKQLLAQEKAKWREEMVKSIPLKGTANYVRNTYKDGWNDCIEEMLKRIKELSNMDFKLKKYKAKKGYKWIEKKEMILELDHKHNFIKTGKSETCGGDGWCSEYKCTICDNIEFF